MDLFRKETFYRSKSTRVLILLGFQIDRSDRSDLPVRSIGDARPATWSRPVRPLKNTGQTGLFDQCQFWSSTYAPCFLVMLAYQKNKPLNQNCLRTMINMHRPYFILRAINSIGHILLLFQADDETTCLGLYICFMVADLAGTTSTCCSIDSILRIRCSLLFWV